MLESGLSGVLSSDFTSTHGRPFHGGCAMRSLFGVGLLLTLGLPIRAEPAARSVREIAGLIDRRISEKQPGIQAASVVDDATFLRRAHLDLVGRIPRVSDLRAFLDDVETDKRERAVEALLASAAYPAHLGSVWRRMLLRTTAQPGPAFKAWVEQQFRDDIPYDRMVRAVLTVPVSRP